MYSPPLTTAGHRARVVADGFPRIGGVMTHTQQAAQDGRWDTRIVETHAIARSHGEDELETIDDRGRRRHHLRPQPRRRRRLRKSRKTFRRARPWRDRRRAQRALRRSAVRRAPATAGRRGAAPVARPQSARPRAALLARRGRRTWRGARAEARRRGSPARRARDGRPSRRPHRGEALEELGLGLVPDVRDHDQVDVRGDEPRAPTT
jgi:hypothetical protein